MGQVRLEKWSEIHTAAVCKAVEATVRSRCLNLRGGNKRKGSKKQPHEGTGKPVSGN